MNITDIDDIYPSSPLQKATLSADAQGLLQRSCGFFKCSVRGALDVAKFEGAWQKVVERHPLLRTSFVWKHMSDPVQLIRKHAPVRFQYRDGRPLTAQQQSDESQAHRRSSLEEGLDPSEPALFRLTLCQTAEDEYELACVYHYLVLDSWSLPLMLEEVLSFYESISSGRDPEIKVDQSFREYVVRLQSQDLSDARMFWQELFKDFTGPTSLRIDRRPASSETRNDSHGTQRFHLSSETLAHLQRLTGEHNLTLGVLMQAVWSLLLSRYSGEEVVTFGITVSGRNSEIEGSESVIGPFMNTLPMRLKVSSDLTMLQWLNENRRLQTSLRRYSEIPQMQVREWSEVPADTPMFDNSIVVDDLRDIDHLSIGRGQVTARDLEILERAPSPLTLRALPGNDLAMEVSFESSGYGDAAISQIMSHLRTLIEATVAHPEQPLFEFSLLSDAVKRQILLEWNDTTTPYPREQCVHQLFEYQVTRTPDALAVIFEGQYLTYDELNRRSNQLADYLRSVGAGPETLVGVVVERSIELIVGLLGILKAGCAYVALDPGFPPSRLALILEEVQAPVLLTQEHLADKLPSESSQKVILDSGWHLLAERGDKNLGNLTSADNLAYVTYTSGSTGTPKGIAITHRNVVRLVKGTNYARLTSEEVFIQLAPISFDASTFEVWGCLLNGARLVVMPPRNPELQDLAEVIERNGVTMLFLTSGLFHLMVEERVKDFKPIRQLLAGGDIISAPHVNKVLQELSDCRFSNIYGPTENTTFTSVYPVDRSAQLNRSVPIGKPINNTRVYLLDTAMQPAAIGVPGDLYIGGDGLGRGYMNKPDLTADRFIPDPFSVEGERLYKSGDLACYLPDGNIDFIGRNDQQVKIRGFRIELGEIEAALAAHPLVRTSVVVARQEGETDKRLVAYVVPEEDRQPSENDLRFYLKQKLPDFALPSAIVMMEKLPLTPNGKVNRQALPAPPHARSDLIGNFQSPRTAVEAVIASIWAKIFAIDEVGVHDNFFALGGHSLLATKMIARVRDALKAPVNVLSIFEQPTVAGLAELVQKAMMAGRQVEAPPIERASRTQELRLSFAQQRLWFLDQLEPGNSFYNIPAAVRMRGHLDVPALEATLSAIVRRHESLRTTFADSQDEPIQVIREPEPVRIRVRDLSRMAEEDRDAEVQRSIMEEAGQPFDLLEGPLMRVGLLKLADDDQVLMLTMHHIVSDEWSMGILIKEMGALYKEYRQGREPRLEELSIQYADFAQWQREWLKGDVLDRQLTYWKEHLKDAPPVMDLPSDRPRPAVRSYRGASRARQLPASMAADLRALSNRYGVTLFMTTLAAFEALIYRYTGREDIVIGIPIANRNQSEIQELIGFFANTLVIRNNVSGDLSLADLLLRVRDVALEAYIYQELPFEKLVEELQPERSLSHTPILQVMFALQSTGQHNLDLEGLTLDSVDSESDTSKFDLTLFMSDSGSTLSQSIEYNSDLFDAERIVRMMGHYEMILASMVKDPERRISAVSFLTEAEQQQLREWNETAAEYSRASCAHALVEEQARNRPEAIAVVDKQEQITYGEFNRRANQLANYLTGKGAGPGSLVAICLEQSAEMIIALLGILKTGAAYLSLDTDYPPERLSFMLEDAKPLALLSEWEMAQSIPASGATLVCIDSDREQIAAQSDEDPAIGVDPNNLAYVIYTSGSTGKPKGVEIAHDSLLNLVHWHHRYFGVTPEDRTTKLASVSFDASVWELWPYLAQGASIHVPDEDTASSPALLRDWLISRAITITFLATPLAEVALDMDWPPRMALRYLMTAGDRLRHYPSASIPFELINNYGPTENTVIATCAFVPAQEQSANAPSIGRPIANTQVYILEQHLRPVPVGMAGEICLGGDNLARGYLNSPELTAEKFQPNPFSGRPGARLYRTGDLARYLPDGQIDYLDRIDRQVKVRGFRIELAEIEVVLGEHPSVGEAVVVARETDPGEKQLVAYVVAAKDSELAINDLRAYLRRKLPDYMIPSIFMPMDVFPLTTAGKLDRLSLPTPSAVSPDPAVNFVLPRTPLEEEVANIWKEVLRVDQVGIHDNFFDIGGHSLRATMVTSRLRKTLRVDLSLHTLFEFPTVAELTVAIVQNILEQQSSQTLDQFSEIEEKSLQRAN